MVENTSNTYINNEEESTLSLNDIWVMIWGYKWWYVASIFICLCVVIFYIYKTPNTYQRTTKVIIDETEQSSTMRNLTQLTGNITGLRANSTVANEMEAFTSPDLMEKVVERLNLQTRYYDCQFMRNVEYYQNSPIELRLIDSNPKNAFSFLIVNLGNGQVLLKDFVIGPNEVEEEVQCALNQEIMTPVGKISIVPTIYLENFNNDIRVNWSNSMARAKGICQKLSVSLSGKESTVVILSLEDFFPGRADNILSTLMDTYNEDWIRNKNRSARNTSDFINDRLLLIEQELGGVEQELKQYKEQNKLTDISAVAQKYLEESTQYSSKAFDINNQLSVANYIKEYLNNPSNATSLIPVNLGLTSAGVETLIQEYNDIVLQRDRLSDGSGSNNPLIADLNNTLGAMRAALLRSIDNYISTLNLQAERIEGQENQIMERIAASSGQELELLSIQRQQMVKESLYVFLLQKREENEIASLINVGNTRMIVSPNGSSAPVAPNKMMLLLIAIILGCGIPFAYIFLMNIVDTTVKSKTDFVQSQVPFLGEIPLLSKRSKFGFASKKAKYNNENCRIIVEEGKRDMMNEAFRVLRTNFDMVVDKKDGEAFVAMFTSFNPNAGKTFLIQNLAASMALKDAKVLLLDLDMRKATLSKVFCKNHRGVAANLSGKDTNFRAHIDKITENLSILPVGKVPPNPAEILLSDRFESMMAQLRKEYDYIFVDCPPIDIVADAAIITKHVDMTVFVLRAGLLDKKVLPVLDSIYSSGRFTRMTAILNSVDLSSRRIGYGYGYGYGYGNDSDEK